LPLAAAAAGGGGGLPALLIQRPKKVLLKYSHVNKWQR